MASPNTQTATAAAVRRLWGSGLSLRLPRTIAEQLPATAARRSGAGAGVGTGTSGSSSGGGGGGACGGGRRPARAAAFSCTARAAALCVVQLTSLRGGTAHTHARTHITRDEWS